MKKLLLIISLIYMNIFPEHITISTTNQKDILEIAKLHYISWHSTFDSILESQYIDQQTLEYLNNYWTDFFNKKNNNDTVILSARSQNNLIGFICAGSIKSPSEMTKDYTGEIYQLYIAPESQGLGVGSKLMKECLDKLYHLGHNKVIVRVFHKNINAQKFYEKCGGTFISEENFVDYHGILTSKIYGYIHDL